MGEERKRERGTGKTVHTHLSYLPFFSPKGSGVILARTLKINVVRAGTRGIRSGNDPLLYFYGTRDILGYTAMEICSEPRPFRVAVSRPSVALDRRPPSWNVQTKRRCLGSVNVP